MNDLDLTVDPLSPAIQPPTDKELAKHISHKSSRVKTRKKKKEVKPKKPVPARIIICGTTSWISLSQERAMLKALKLLEPKTLDFIVTGTSRGAEQMAVQLAKKLGIPLIQAHPWNHLPNSAYIQRGHVMKLFKPTLILAFNEDIKNNQATTDYEKLARRADIEFKVVGK